MSRRPRRRNQENEMTAMEWLECAALLAIGLWAVYRILEICFVTGFR